MSVIAMTVEPRQYHNPYHIRAISRRNPNHEKTKCCPFCRKKETLITEHFSKYHPTVKIRGEVFWLNKEEAVYANRWYVKNRDGQYV